MDLLKKFICNQTKDTTPKIFAPFIIALTDAVIGQSLVEISKSMPNDQGKLFIKTYQSTLESDKIQNFDNFVKDINKNLIKAVTPEQIMSFTANFIAFLDKEFSLYSNSHKFGTTCKWVFTIVSPYIITLIAKGTLELTFDTELSKIDDAVVKVKQNEDAINKLVTNFADQYNKVTTNQELAQQYIKGFSNFTTSELSTTIQASLLGDLVSLVNYEIDSHINI